MIDSFVRILQKWLSTNAAHNLMISGVSLNLHFLIPVRQVLDVKTQWSAQHGWRRLCQIDLNA